MNNADIQKLIDEGEAILKETTVGYAGHSLKWQQNQTTKWWKGLDKLHQARKALDILPPSTISLVESPEGPFTEITGDYWKRDFSIGGTISKVAARTAPAYGIALMGYFGGPDMPPVPNTSKWLISDCIDIAGKEPPVLDGRGEAGGWYGISNITATRCEYTGTWMGLWTGCQFNNALITHHRATSPRIGLYMEHASKNFRFEYCHFKGGVNGANIEWMYTDKGYSPYMSEPMKSRGIAGTCDGVFYRTIFEGGREAAFLDAGTCGIEFIECKFIGPIGIYVPNNSADSNRPIKFTNCDWSGIKDQTKKIIYHNNAIG